MNEPEGITYHIQIHHTKKSVEVSSLGINMVDAELDGYYTSVDDLPLWVQTKLSLLMMLSVPPPLNDLVGVGSRLGPYLYWVYK